MSATPLSGGRRPLGPMLTALLVVMFSASDLGAGEPPYVYSLNQTGRIALKGTPVETLLSGPFRFTDLRAVGGARYALRGDGTIFRNGSVYVTQAVAGPQGLTDSTSWIRLRVVGSAAYALSAGGRVTRDGLLVRELNAGPLFEDGNGQPVGGGSLFADLLVTPFGSFALRLDGVLFSVDSGEPLGDFQGGLGVTGRADGTADDTVWERLERRGSELVALRADGKVHGVRLSDLSEAGEQTFLPLIGPGEDVGTSLAELPSSPASTVVSGNIYVDLELVGGSPYVMRRDGAVFGPGSSTLPLLNNVGAANFVGNPYTSPQTGGSVAGNPFMDMAVFGSQVWRLRSLGQFYADDLFLDALLGTQFIRLSIDIFEPGFDGLVNQKPTVAVYRPRVIVGDDIRIPILPVDVDQPLEDLTLSFDFGKFPGAVYDAEQGVVLRPAGLAAGKYSFRVTVDDGQPGKTTRQNYKVVILEPEPDPTRNRPPEISKISRVRALVDTELVLEVITADANGDEVTVTDDGKGIFAKGAVFDPETNTIRWTPGCLDVGRNRALLKISDGQKTKTLRITITVLFPLFWEDEVSPTDGF